MKTLLSMIALVVLCFFGQAFGQTGVGEGGASLEVENIPATKIGGKFKYAVKFLCLEQSPFLAAGTYRTAINILNPQGKPVTFTKKGVLTKPEGEPQSPLGLLKTETLDPDKGVEITCNNIILELLGAPGLDFPATGFVVIESPKELNVTAVYTGPPVISVVPPT